MMNRRSLLTGAACLPLAPAAGIASIIPAPIPTFFWDHDKPFPWEALTGHDHYYLVIRWLWGVDRLELWEVKKSPDGDSMARLLSPPWVP